VLKSQLEGHGPKRAEGHVRSSPHTGTCEAQGSEHTGDWSLAGGVPSLGA